jgi:hypothetical protein
VATRTVFVPAPDAHRVVEMAAAPALPIVAAGIATSIEAHVPERQGVLREHFHAVAPARYGFEGDGSPVGRVYIQSSRWHFVEYGKGGSPAYRPIANGVAALGLRYEAAGR